VVKTVTQVALGEAERRECRGFERQRPRRELEVNAQEQAARLTERLRRRGTPHGEIARRLWVTESRLGDWRARLRQKRLCATARGRPPRRLSPLEQEAVQTVLDLVGPSIGLPSLRSIFPRLAKRELRYQLRRFRKTFREDNRRVVHALRWTQPGRVWAIDFKEPPTPVDGVFPQVASVCDVASGKHLEWLPVRHADADTVHDLLLKLFVEHGVPLVIKMDNAGCFRSPKVHALLEKHGVWWLHSPPYAPTYNGSVEAGIGALSAYTFWQSSRNDRPAHWTCDDIRIARKLANALSHPEGRANGSLNERWEQRSPIDDNERKHFRGLVSDRYNQLWNAETKHLGRELEACEKSVVERTAVALALRDGGLLSTRKRRIRPVIKIRGLA